VESSSADANCGESARVAAYRPVRIPLSGHIAVAAVALAIAPASVRAAETAPDARAVEVLDAMYRSSASGKAEPV
jgi:hypothetical protein